MIRNKHAQYLIDGFKILTGITAIVVTVIGTLMAAVHAPIILTVIVGVPLLAWVLGNIVNNHL